MLQWAVAGVGSSINARPYRPRPSSATVVGSAAVLGANGPELRAVAKFRTALRYFFGASSFFIMALSFFAMSAHMVSFFASFFVASFATIAV